MFNTPKYVVRICGTLKYEDHINKNYEILMIFFPKSVLFFIPRITFLKLKHVTYISPTTKVLLIREF